jgi:hypothetical protein
VGWFTPKLGIKTYHCIGWTPRDPETRVFRNVALPGRGVMRLMDKGVHQAALESATQKLRELGRKSGKKSLFYDNDRRTGSTEPQDSI